MEAETLTLGKLAAKTLTLAWGRIWILLGWGMLAFFLCFPPSVFIALQLGTANVGPINPVSIWRSLPPLGKLGMFLSTWFVSFGLLGFTQAVVTLVTWDDHAAKPTTLGNLAARLLAKLHRILGLQLLVVPMSLILVPLTMFATAAILLENSGVFAGIRKSLHLLSWKAILVLFFAWIVSIGWSTALGPIATHQGGGLLYLAAAIELRISMFYLVGVLVGIPTTLLYCQGRDGSSG